jgi:hypothetical protein
VTNTQPADGVTVNFFVAGEVGCSHAMVDPLLVGG